MDDVVCEVERAVAGEASARAVDIVELAIVHPDGDLEFASTDRAVERNEVGFLLLGRFVKSESLQDGGVKEVGFAVELSSEVTCVSATR